LAQPIGATDWHPVALAGSYDAALALGLAGVCPRVPLVFLFHSEFYSEWVQALGHGPNAVARQAIRAYMAAVERRVFHLSVRIVAVSAFSARQVQERAPSAAAKVRIVPTGVDTDYFRPPEDTEAAKLAIGRSPNQFLVLGVGRLVAVKQFDRLITAFASARRAGLDARLVIAGDGLERSRLAGLIAHLGVADCVDLEGYCDPARLRALMQAADLQVCSSAFENFSLAILEGLACGTPVLGTPGGGTPELVGSVDTSLVLQDDAPGTIAAALKRLACDRAGLRRLGARARALAAERYDWERVVDQLESVCAEVSPAWA
jgi:glycosyltransferase involved in cell wall biosynthesis